MKKLITIISSTFNAGDALKTTIKSIRDQVFHDFEWIVIDGKSTDNTISIIKENLDIISFWQSEKDEGIYDAWNKSLSHIKGKWVIFLGAGDKFYSNTVLEEASIYLSNNDDRNLIYGKTQLVSEDSKSDIRMWGAPWDSIKNSWEGLRPALPPHPSSFVKSSIFHGINAYSFPKQLKIAGDSHLLLTLVKQKEPLFIPVVIDIMPIGGASTLSKNQRTVIKELKFINNDLQLEIPINIKLKGLFKTYVYMVLTKFISQEKFLEISNKIK